MQRGLRLGGSQQTVTWSASASLCNRLDTGPGAAGRGAGNRRVLSARGRIKIANCGARLAFLSTVRLTFRRIAFALEKGYNFLHCNSAREKGEIEIHVNCVERGVG